MIRRIKRFKFDLSFPCMQPKVFQRLGETQATDIEVQVLSEGVPYNLTGVRLGFEMRDDEGKIVIDEDQSRFTLTDVTKGNFTYRVSDNVFGFHGNAYLCYFVLKISGVRITTERFIITNDEDVQKHTSGLRGHYVSVIDDLVASNKQAMEEAQKIKAMIEANQAMKKSGDTMTGNLLIDGASGIEKRLAFSSGGQTLFGFNTDSKNVITMRDWKNALPIFNYDATSKVFNVSSDTNLVKKSEIYSKWVTPDGRSTGINDSDLNTIISPGIYTGQRLVNAPEGSNNFFYIEVVPYTNTSYVMQRATILNNANQRIWLRTLQNNVWQPWIEVTGRGKDGRANLTLTADATTFNNSYPPIVERRGNTATLRMAITRNAGSTGTIMTTLPVDMRPVSSQVQTMVATDGSWVLVTIGTEGNVSFLTAGKNVYVSITYVVN